MDKASVAVGYPPLLHSTTHKRALRHTLTYYGERNPCVPGYPASHHQGPNTECTYSRLVQLRKKRNKSKKEPVWRSSNGALRAYPDDRLED